MIKVTADALRARCEELHALETLEPEDVYELVADEFGIELDEFYEILDDENKQEPVYDQRHGGPFDRGSADSYYHRPFNPHYYRAGTGTSQRIELADMTAEEIVAYTAGYRYNEQHGDKKDWG